MPWWPHDAVRIPNTENLGMTSNRIPNAGGLIDESRQNEKADYLPPAWIGARTRKTLTFVVELIYR